ncbi:hypothetical protein VHEMI06230 [[Torrubiella] hemipterigena]|uniref:Ribonuclease P protein subunit n=1 Tax=[Torrubiella] hemipterigena TaxID=1531966 RepID=A0A0A1TKK5_9HYPO|nr:hypothetical protein VHEMI06230 [[Torrubiella] hemipterigena]
MSDPTDGRPVKALLARAHSPASAERLYKDKIEHRKLHLRATSPPPAVLNARASRRKARQAAKDKKKQRPKPLSSRQQRQLGLYDIPKSGQRYEVYAPLNKLWQGYAREILGSDIYIGGAPAAAKLSSAEFHGAEAEVVRSSCTDRVGIKGIIVRDRKFVFEILTMTKGLKIVPKEGTTFRIEVEYLPREGQHDERFAFEVLGDQLIIRSADRANRKFKQHFLKNV